MPGTERHFASHGKQKGFLLSRTTQILSLNLGCQLTTYCIENKVFEIILSAIRMQYTYIIKDFLPEGIETIEESPNKIQKDESFLTEILSSPIFQSWISCLQRDKPHLYDKLYTYYHIYNQ